MLNLGKAMEEIMFTTYNLTPVTIDSVSIAGRPIDKEEFIKKFNELGTLLESDDRKFWIIYEERFIETPYYHEIFWCIPSGELNFIFEDGEWYLFEEAEIVDFEDFDFSNIEDPADEYPDWVKSEEDKETYKKNVEKYKHSLKMYADFEEMFAQFIMYDKRATSDDFIVWQKLRAWTNVPDEEVSDDNKVIFIDYVYEFWHAFFMDVVDGSYEYMNILRMVWEAWEEN